VLEITECITIDAMGCQKKSSPKSLAKADYVLALKGNRQAAGQVKWFKQAPQQ